VSLQPVTKSCDGIDSSQWLGERVPDQRPRNTECSLPGIKSVQYWTNLKHLSLGQWCLIDVRIGWGWMAHVFVKIVPLLGGAHPEQQECHIYGCHK